MKYRFQAHDRYAKVKTGTIEADSSAAAAEQIRNEFGLTPTKIEAIGATSAPAQAPAPAQQARPAVSVAQQMQPARQRQPGEPLVYNPSMRMNDIDTKVAPPQATYNQAAHQTIYAQQGDQAARISELTPEITEDDVRHVQAKKAEQPKPGVKLGGRSVHGGHKPSPDATKMDGFGIEAEVVEVKDTAMRAGLIGKDRHKDVCAAVSAVTDTMKIMDDVCASIPQDDQLAVAWQKNRDKFYLELIKAALVKTL